MGIQIYRNIKQSSIKSISVARISNKKRSLNFIVHVVKKKYKGIKMKLKI